jgi:hypothetical protein
LFVTKRELRRTPSPVVFFVYIQFLLDSPNGRLLQISFGLNVTQGITILKKKNDKKALNGRCGSHGMMKKGKNDCSDGNWLNLYQYSYMTLFIVPTVHHMVVKHAEDVILLK